MRQCHTIRRFGVCTTVSLATALLCLPAAFAQNPPTTPVPTPADPEQARPSDPAPAPVQGPIVADAGTGIGVLRILPGSVPGDSIFNDPEFEKQFPKQSLAEFGMGLAVAQANSYAYLGQERAVAESSPFGFAIGGHTPRVPGSLSQTALPDHPEPTTGGLRPPPSPADQLLKLGLMEGSVHARWDERLGPCVQPIADAKTSLASVSAVNVLPSLPGTPEELTAMFPPGTAAPGLDEQTTAKLRDQLSNMAGPMERLSGLLAGQTSTEAGTGSLLHLPDAIEAHSNVQLVDVPGQHGKGVRSTSTMQIASFRLLSGLPQELRIDVVSKPRLTATSTGAPETSTVDYEAPVLRVSQGGKELGVIDAANPQLDVPIGIPLPEAGIPTEVPLLGHPIDPNIVDIGVLRMSIGELRKEMSGAEIRAGARLFDLKILPGDSLGIPSSLAEVSFGEQVARASAPSGGVVCELPAAGGPAVEQPRPVPPLAKTSGAYYSVPLFWTGAGLLLLGAILVAALPRRR